MMKKTVALVVLIVVAGQSLFCVDFHLGGRRPGASAVYHEEWESVRLDRSLAHFAPDNVRPEPMASSSGSGESYAWVWPVIFVPLGLVLIGVGALNEDKGDDAEMTNFLFIGSGVCAIGASLLVWALD